MEHLEIDSTLVAQSEATMFQYIANSIRTVQRVYTRDKAEMLSNWEYRREEAYKTFILLYQNNRFYDAMMESGYILELSSLIYDINNTTKVDTYNKHLIMYSISSIVRILMKLNLPHMPIDAEMQYLYATHLAILEKAGTILLRKNYQLSDVIEVLKDPNISSNKKLELIKRSFKTPSIDAQIINFLKYIKKKIQITNNTEIKGNENLFRLGYETYCTLKHNGIGAFEFDDLYLKHTSLFLIYCIRVFEIIGQ